MITCPIFARRCPLWLGMDGWLGNDIHVRTRAAGVVVKRSSQAGGGYTQLKQDEPRNSLIGNGYQVTATTDWPWNWKIRIAIYHQSIRCCSSSVRYRVVIRKQTTKYCITWLFRLQNKNLFIPQKCWPEITSKHKPLTQCRTNVGSASTTLVQHWSYIGSCGSCLLHEFNKKNYIVAWRCLFTCSPAQSISQLKWFRMI